MDRVALRAVAAIRVGHLPAGAVENDSQQMATARKLRRNPDKINPNCPRIS
jgi:hypothetical protein